MLQTNKSCIIGVIYRHPHQSLPLIISKFEKSIEMLNANMEAYYISGDFNVDLTKYENDSMIKNYTDMILSLGCIPLIHCPTRITMNSSTLLDHIYTNKVQNDISNYILQHNISNHLPMAMKANLSVSRSTNRTVTRDTKNFILEDLLTDLALGLNKLNEKNSAQIDCFTNNFINTFHEVLHKHAPLRYRTRKELKLQQKPWISTGLLKSIQPKNNLYQKWLKGRNDSLSN